MCTFGLFQTAVLHDPGRRLIKSSNSIASHASLRPEGLTSLRLERCPPSSARPFPQAFRRCRGRQHQQLRLLRGQANTSSKATASAIAQCGRDTPKLQVPTLQPICALPLRQRPPPWWTRQQQRRREVATAGARVQHQAGAAAGTLPPGEDLRRRGGGCAGGVGLGVRR